MNKEKPFNLILLGDPAAGKATQAKRLVKRYSLREFDFGNWLRRLRTVRARKEFRFSETAGKGILTPTHLARAKFKEIIFGTPRAKGIFFNGNPKKLGEAKLMYKWFREVGRSDPLVIYLSIPKQEMLKRIRIRERVEKRSDDRMHHLRNRMKYYEKDIKSVVAFFKPRYYFKEISGLGTRAVVYHRLVHWIDARK